MNAPRPQIQGNRIRHVRPDAGATSVPALESQRTNDKD
jgi:hypothetical protein